MGGKYLWGVNEDREIKKKTSLKFEFTGPGEAPVTETTVFVFFCFFLLFLIEPARSWSERKPAGKSMEPKCVACYSTKVACHTLEIMPPDR